MIKNFFTRTVITNLQHEPTQSQLKALDSIFDFLSNGNEKMVFILRGYAGTGKTSLLSALIQTLPVFKMNSVLMAPTGRAAKVLTQYSGKMAYTIHKCIYRKKNKTETGGFELNFNKNSDTLFIVDEASMISDTRQNGNVFGSGYLLQDLIDFVFSGKNCRLLLCGDDAQLPPVEISESPALDTTYVSDLGCTCMSAQMNDVVRQVFDSGILFNATVIRKLVQHQKTLIPVLSTANYTDIVIIDNACLTETIEMCYSQYGLGQTKIITRSNKQALRYNQGIRSRIFSYESELVCGDQLMVVKNNYFWLPDDYPVDFIANGDMLQIKKIRKSQELYDCRFIDATVSLSDINDIELDVKLLADAISVGNASMPHDFYTKLYADVEADYAHIDKKKNRVEAVMNDPYFNALQVKYAYAVTCHKAQGGQWQAVFVDLGYFETLEPDIALLRWLYTAFTRATEKLFLVNFKAEFFNDNP